MICPFFININFWGRISQLSKDVILWFSVCNSNFTIPRTGMKVRTPLYNGDFSVFGWFKPRPGQVSNTGPIFKFQMEARKKRNVSRYTYKPAGSPVENLKKTNNSQKKAKIPTYVRISIIQIRGTDPFLLLQQQRHRLMKKPDSFLILWSTINLEGHISEF